MAADRTEAPRTGEADAKAGEAQAAPASSGGGGGFKSWLPLLFNILLMPVVAYFTTTLLLVPKLSATHAVEEGAEGHSAHAETPAGGKTKFTVPLAGKVLVNIAGTAGTRYLLANLSLVGSRPNLRELIEKNEAELRDVAAGVLATKTIGDLEKPGARNLIRAELIAVFNNVLGEGAVSELFLTEFAIQ